MNIEKERKAFQKFWEENCDFENHDNTYFNEKTQSYENDFGEDTQAINISWAAWQASINREGYKLVPVDSLKEIISCAYCHIHDRCIGDAGDDVINHILAMGIED